MRRVSIACGMFLAAMSHTRAEPARITWEWYNTAEVYQSGKLKGYDDLRLSVHYFRLAAEKGNMAAAYKLGEIYENGIGVAKDPLLAFNWYMRAAARNDKHGQLKVGWCYQKGIGVQADPQIAAIWYGVSAGNDNAWAYHMLAFMLADGEGVKKDVMLAKRYFELSLQKTDDHWAKWKLAHLVADENPKRAKELLKEAAAAGNIQAAAELNQ